MAHSGRSFPTWPIGSSSSLSCLRQQKKTKKQPKKQKCRRRRGRGGKVRPYSCQQYWDATCVLKRSGDISSYAGLHYLYTHLHTHTHTHTHTHIYAESPVLKTIHTSIRPREWITFHYISPGLMCMQRHKKNRRNNPTRNVSQIQIHISIVVKFMEDVLSIAVRSDPLCN